MSACVGLVSTITNHPNLAPIRSVGSNTIHIAADDSNDDDAVMLEIEGEKVNKGRY